MTAVKQVEHDKKGSLEIKKGICPVCGLGCHALVHIQDGKIVRITKDPNSPRGKNLCERSVAAVDFHYHPDRVNYPLKRVGERGEGKWERITWDKAIDEITHKLDSLRAEFGPESVAVLGGGHATVAEVAFQRWCNLWGTPNYFWQGKNCGEAEYLAESAIYGYPTMNIPISGITECAIMWGRNAWAWHGNWLPFIQAKKAGMKLVVVDPRLSESAQEADIWVQLRPGTDGALALGMLNVIINEELYDREFVDKWCLGFNELKALAAKYPPDKVENITWVPKEQIIKVARLYATSKPALLTMGVAAAHLGRGATLSAVAGKSWLRAITGNVGKEGGNAFRPNPEITAYLEELHWDKLIAHPQRKNDNVSAHIWPIASVRAF
ncbi:molybdopterin-dependent oxidoreductase, partial [Chloroflexota bacterium]